tara:strand:+ start:128 stop:2560 length:2433 start_codon:yes stop_codon:yes gene_type:complete
MKLLRKLIRYGLKLAILGIGLSSIVLFASYLYIAPDLPDIEELKKVKLQVPLKILSKDGKLIAEYGEKRRSPLVFKDLPKNMVNAIISAEDANFFKHPGVDYRGLLRAGINLLVTGERQQGGSTITMQVARNFYLTREKTYLRKLYEIFLALRIEDELSKQEIMELYLNKIYLGHRSYGVGAAARVYYGKTLDQLTLAETAMIAGLPKAPSRYNPLTNPPRAITRRNYVLNRMWELGYIKKEDYDSALNSPISAKRYSSNISIEASYIAEMVRSEMIERFGVNAYTGGYTVFTTVESKAQIAATKSLRKALDSYSNRHGYHGPEKQYLIGTDEEDLNKILSKYKDVGAHKPAIVIELEEDSAIAILKNGEYIFIPWEGLKWARSYISENKRGPIPKKAEDILNIGDLIRVRNVKNKKGENYWRLSQVPKVSGALISLKSKSGAILALVGGYDFYTSKFNRVTQATRQPGSGFKAFIYSAALENGFTAASIINDAPVVFDDPGLESAWRPENYSGKFFGPTRLRFALIKSRNLVSIRLLRNIGLKNAVNHIKKFGFDSKELPKNLSLSLGSANVTPLQMARGYAVLSNGGFLINPYVIERIEKNGEEIFIADPLIACEKTLKKNLGQHPIMTPYEFKNEKLQENNCLAPRVLDKRNRFLMYSMLQDVIKRGTGRRARALGRKDIAGKTGTTNEQRDAWFNGFNQTIVTNVWVGFDSNKKLGKGEVGGRAALPAWINFMKIALKDTKDLLPEMPEGLVSVKIDPITGKRAATDTKDAIFEIFREEYIPNKNSSKTKIPGNETKSNPEIIELF